MVRAAPKNIIIPKVKKLLRGPIPIPDPASQGQPGPRLEFTLQMAGPG